MLSDCVNAYLSLRRAAGFKLDTVETYLRSYADFATSRGDTHVVRNTVLDWAAKARSDDSRGRRLDQLIRFARFARADDPRHDIPPDHVFCKRQHRRIRDTQAPPLRVRASTVGGGGEPVLSGQGEDE